MSKYPTFKQRVVTVCYRVKYDNYESFQKIKKKLEKVELNFKSKNNEDYTKRFNLDVLVTSIQLSHGSATGLER